MPQSRIISVEFIVPYSKETITNANLKQATYKEFLCSILRKLPLSHIGSVTCIKSHVTKHAQHEKQLESIKIIAPNSLQDEFQRIISEGVPYKNRIIYAYRNSDVSSAEYPKQFTLKYRNLPHFLSDEEIIEACNLQNYKIKNLRHQKEQISDEIEAYTGICYADIEILNKQELEEIITWNEKAFLSQFTASEIPFNCCIQTLLQCENCKEENRQFMGHHKKQCKQKLTPLNDSEATMSSIEEESAPESDNDPESDNEQPAQKQQEQETDNSQNDKKTNPNEKTIIADDDMVMIYDANSKCSAKIYTVKSAIQNNPEIQKPLKSCDATNANFSIGDVTYNLDFFATNIAELEKCKVFEMCVFKNLRDQSIIHTAEELKNYIGKYDMFFNPKRSRLYCTNLNNEVKQKFILLNK